MLSHQSEYQHIVVTESRRPGALPQREPPALLADEYRYHEALVHPAMGAARRRAHVVVGGGGEGNAVREILKWPDVASVTLVDLDRAVTELSATNPTLARLNGGALRDPRVRVIDEDAERWFEGTRDVADVVSSTFRIRARTRSSSICRRSSERRHRHLSGGGASSCNRAPRCSRGTRSRAS